MCESLPAVFPILFGREEAAFVVRGSGWRNAAPRDRLLSA